jgi:hypothetical protein
MPARRPRRTAIAAVLTALTALTPTGASAEPVDIARFRNHVSICHTPADTCNFDEVGYGYAATAALIAGVEGGSPIEADGLTYTWPDVPAGAPDNVTMVSQVIPVAGDGATKVGFLGASHHGPVTAEVKLRYATTDAQGTTTTVDVPHQLTFSDWTLGGGGQQLSRGNTIALEMAYRAFAPVVMPTTTYAFSLTVPVDPSRGDLVAIVLPRVTSVRLFDIALG